jgi:hypothetical protein
LGLSSFVYVRVMRQRECQTDAHAGQDMLTFVNFLLL